MKKTNKLGNRKRINLGTEEVVDHKLYVANCCSQNAKKFHEYTNNLFVELWIDKHCSLRQIERIGIDLDVLQDLSMRSVSHLIYYQLREAKFNVIQYPEYKGKDKRIVIQELTSSGDLLNIVIECHFLDISLYEVTLITAMIENNFRVFDGQYYLRIDGESSELFRKVSNKEQKITDFGI